MSSVVILAGAGSGPDISTTYLTDELLKWRGALEPQATPVEFIRRRFSRNEALNSLLRRIDSTLYRDADKRPFFRWLVDVSAEAYPTVSAGEHYRPSITSPNFEELIHVVERLTYILREPYYDSLYKRPPPFEAAFYELSSLGKLVRSRVPMYDVLVNASNFILDSVAAAAATHPHVDASDLVSSVAAYAKRKVFSLNYDSRVVDLTNHWWTSFRALDPKEASERDTKPGVEVFEPKPDVPSDVDAFIAVLRSAADYWGDRLRVYICSLLSAEAFSDEATFLAAIKERVGFLGATGHRWRPTRSAITADGVVALGNQIRIAIDGLAFAHANDVRVFLNS